MSLTLGDTEPVVIDLTAPPPSVPEKRRRTSSIRAGLRRYGPLCLVLLVGVLVFETMGTSVMYQYRQRHLAAGFRHPNPEPKSGDAVALLQAPSIGLNQVVVAGDTVGNLRGGPAWRRSSAAVGEVGNTVVLGHATRYGGPFGDLGQLKRGDPIFLGTNETAASKYVVRSIERVGSGPSPLVGHTDDVRLTLVTSSGGRFSNSQLVVVATAADGDLAVSATKGPLSASTSGVFGSALGDIMALTILGYLLFRAFEWLRTQRAYSPVSIAVVLAPGVLLFLLLTQLTLEQLLPSTL